MMVPVVNAMVEMGVFDAVPLNSADGIALADLAGQVGMDPEILGS